MLLNETHWRLIAGVVLVAASVLAGFALDEPGKTVSPSKVVDFDEDTKGRPVESMTRGYISSTNCRECHAEYYDSWHASHHRTMTQVPSKESVLADFDNKVLMRSGYQFRFFRDEDEYFMETKKLEDSTKSDGPTSRTFKIVLMTGAHHQQAFWCETDKGRTLAKIPFIWINKEQRWVPYGSIFLMPPSGLSMHAGVWNSNCIKCHVVGGQPRLDAQNGFDSHVAEFGISCEACHGPGEAHAAFHGKELGRDPDHRAIGNAQMINPAKLSHQKSSQTCGQCHAVFDFYDAEGQREFFEQGFPFRPGDELRDTRHVFQFGKDNDLPIVKQKLKRNPKFWEQQFWSDGMVRVSGREFNGLLETACYQKGTMSCMSCHDMHPAENDHRPREQWADDQMQPQMRGNRACIQCHEEYKSEERLARHSHHAANSTGSNCYNCHMPHTTLGLMKAMRSHTIDSPNVATTVSTGRPNACNLCHLDKTLAWTSEHLEQWYEIPKPNLSDQEKQVASSVRWLLKGDAGQRAIVGWHLGWAPAQEASGTTWMAPFLAELLTDRYEVVRFIAYHSLKTLPGFSDFEYDFVGSKPSIERGRNRVSEIWSTLADRPFPSKALLIDDKKTLLEREFERLRKQRIDPPMTLIE